MSNRILLIISIFVQYEFSLATLGPMAGPIGEFDLMTIGICPFKDTQNSKPRLELIKPGNTKMIMGNITLKSEINDKTTYKLMIHKWTGSEYKKNVFKMDGPMCAQGRKFADKLFLKIYSSCVPKVTDKCNMKKGFYKLEKFQAVPKDVTLPSMFYGKLKAEFHIYNGKDEIICILAEGDSKPPKSL